MLILIGELEEETQMSEEARVNCSHISWKIESISGNKRITENLRDLGKIFTSMVLLKDFYY